MTNGSDDDTPVTEEEEQKIVLLGLHGITKALLDGFRAGGHKSPPVGYVRALLEVAMEQGLCVDEYAARLKQSKSTTSRHLLDIGDRNRKNEPGLGLVTSRVNPRNRRRVEYFLTPRGRDLVETLALGMDRIKAALEAIQPEPK